MLLGPDPPGRRHGQGLRRPTGRAPCRPAGSAPCCRAARCCRTSRSANWSAMFAALHRHPMPVPAGDGTGRHHRHRRAEDHQAVRRPVPAGPLRAGAGARPRPAGARRADGRHGCRGPPGVLGVDARVHREPAGRCCSPPTTWTRPTPSPTGWSCWPTASIVADGTGAQIKASVAGRTISAVIPGAGPPSSSASCPGSSRTEQQATRILLHCNDSDTALRALLAGFPAAHDIEIAAGNLEDAFLELTAATPPGGEPMSTAPTATGAVRHRRHDGSLRTASPPAPPTATSASWCSPSRCRCCCSCCTPTCIRARTPAAGCPSSPT